MCGQVSLHSMGTPPPIQIATLGMWDTLILMVIALVVFGPRRLPQIGRQIGKLMYEFRKASNDFKFQMEEELRSAEEADRRKTEEERLRALALTAPAAAEVVSQVSEASSVAPATVQSAAAVMESQYPEQTQYPPLDDPESPTETSAEETYPRIQPPSTGEQVPAAKPTSRAAQTQAADEAGATVSVEASHELDAAAEAVLLPGADELRANEAALNPSEDHSPDTAKAAQHG
jgi:sec-independent protein translocase protein TatB